MEIEGYDVVVIGNPTTDMYCIICLKLMRDAIQMECGHGMCQFCFDKLEHFAKVRAVPLLCPTCRAATREDKTIKVPMIDRIILALTVKCSNSEQGCNWIGELGDMKMHLITNCECSDTAKTGDEASNNVEVKIPSIIAKNESKGADICGTNNKFYIIRPDIGVYLRSTNFHQGLDLSTYSLHKNCIGEHYLSTGDKFYIIKGDKYHRVTNLNHDSNAATYYLHPTCKGGDFYFCNGPMFGIIFFDKNLCHFTENMANNADPVDIKLPDEFKDGLYHWGIGYKHYCLKQSGWELEYFRYSSVDGKKEDNYGFNSTVASFLPGGISITKGPSQGLWKCIYSEKNTLATTVSITKEIQRNHGFKVANLQLPSFDDGLKSKLVLAQFRHDFIDNEKILLYLLEENWRASKDVKESLRFRLNCKEEVYVWQYVLGFKHCADIFYSKFLAYTDTVCEPEDDISSMM